MPEWPTNPDWVEPDNINGGYQYEPADGVTFADFNNIIANLMYLKNHGSAGLQPQLHAPSLSIYGSTLTINSPPANGDFASEFKVYADTILIATVSNPIVDLSTYLTEPDSYSITAKCCGTNFLDSDFSIAVTYTIIVPATAPTITTQPQAASYSAGSTATPLTVAASVSDGGTLSYQWQKSTDSGTSYSDISGATSSTYTPDVSTASTYMYRCVVTNTLGATTASTTSNAATITVTEEVVPYLTFQSVNPFTISMSNTRQWNGTMQYSTDTENWTSWSGFSSISSVDGKLYLRGTGNTRVCANSTGSYHAHFIITGTAVECVGNIETLLDWQTVLNGEHPIMDSWCFYNAFLDCSALITAPDLPAETLTDHGCYGMYRGCTNLTTAPALPATTLAYWCCGYMFYGCTKLTTVPALPANTLGQACYYRMFYGCTNLKVSATQTGAYQHEWRIPTEGTISSTPYNWNKEMLTGTGGTFTSDPAINTTYYVENQPVA